MSDKTTYHEISEIFEAAQFVFGLSDCRYEIMD